MPSPQTSAPPVDQPSSVPGGGDRFFEWTSTLGVMRMDGWFGGVAAGAAARWGVDPLIVRGILVVLAIIGFPVALVYGAAWAFLPDTTGRIPAQEAWHRRFHAGQVGAVLFIAASFVPAPLPLILGIPSLVVLGGAYLGDVGVVVLLLAAAAIVFSVVAVLVAAPWRPRRVQAATAGPAEPDAPEWAVSDPPPDRDAPAEPETPAGAATADDLARWREQHAAWKEQDQAWRREQQDAARAARDQLRRERQESAAAFAAEAAAKRRERHAIAPRAPLAFVALAVGIAVIAGTIVALSTAGGDPIAAGLFAAALVLAGAMTASGALRRRSGFLAFVTAVTLLGGAAATGVTVGRELHVGSLGIANDEIGATSFFQPWGDLSIYLANIGGSPRDMHVQKRTGVTIVMMADDVRMDLEVVTTDASVGVSVPDGYLSLEDITGAVATPLSGGRTRYTVALGDTTSPETTQKVLLEQDAGYIEVSLDYVPNHEGNPS
ncbi:phage shock protein PspC (stress-responsive transcriptional regulator) [Microbacterium sp. SORGH_AS 505]|uniref:PspC domain-containing protein n=1 Tax=Microbacterium sp. SORGH_AS_0505 TaxID=3041770 RepID=UPI00278860F5|nr:PspC domain-containing protein [Microbacterium sp. SORGH_AS_0505]MDQ1125429.1 phage shock protein PspC (stress-responsive transcriptional regulator) [Microbacterium sp. SORGH_AS_0505]